MKETSLITGKYRSGVAEQYGQFALLLDALFESQPPLPRANGWIGSVEPEKSYYTGIMLPTLEISGDEQYIYSGFVGEENRGCTFFWGRWESAIAIQITKKRKNTDTIEAVEAFILNKYQPIKYISWSANGSQARHLDPMLEEDATTFELLRTFLEKATISKK